ncbi:MAG TPA: TIM barrel protein [Armatimonadota bacterium]|jgi:xylose isomerase
MALGSSNQFRFSAGVWNLHSGADPFGPPVRPDLAFAEKIRVFKDLGFDYVQFHDDDVVSADASAEEMKRTTLQVKKMLEDAGLKAEFVAPRIWEDPRTVDGAITSNFASEREYALFRGRRSIDIANLLETDRIVLWPAREGTYIREAKDPVTANGHMLEFLNALLRYDPNCRILGEMKPNEPMDLMYCPTTGHFLALAYKTCDPSRVGVLIESAHCVLAGLDPSDEMGNALFHGKLWGVHLNDQNGLKFDQDKSFGSANLRRAFNQVDVLLRHGFGRKGEVVGLDVKVMRTQPAETAFLHLKTSKDVFLMLEDLARTIDRQEWQSYVDQRNYEGLDLFILRSLLGKQ